MKLRPYSSTLIALAGLLLMLMGIYFMFLRPSLLPEDLRYMNVSLPKIQDQIPDLQTWLKKVFWVMGGYIFTTGLLTIYISYTSFRARLPKAFAIVLISAISSIGSMTVVNFILGSEFKWVLLIFSLIWATSLVLYRFNK